jgi:hypothetical protein
LKQPEDHEQCGDDDTDVCVEEVDDGNFFRMQ